MSTEHSQIPDEKTLRVLPATHSELLRARIHKSEGLTTLILSGELDVAGLPLIEKRLKQAEEDSQGCVAIDLEQLTFIEGTGVHALMQAETRARSGGWEFRIVDAGGPVRRVFRLVWPEILVDEVVDLAITPQETLLPGDRAQDVNTDLDAIDAVLQRVVTLAAQTVFRADGASISLARNDRLSTVAASNEAVLAMDADQYELREGPCFSASADGEWHQSAYLAEESRWPAFTARAMARGISSILSIPLVVRRAPMGALNLCSKSPRAFDGEREQTTASLLARQASIFLEVHADGPITLEALRVEATRLGVEEALLMVESMDLAKTILKESLRDRETVGVSADDRRGFAPPSADERRLREMVSDIPWSAA